MTMNRTELIASAVIMAATCVAVPVIAVRQWNNPENIAGGANETLWSQAIARYEKAEDGTSMAIRAKYSLGRAYFQNGKIQEAADVFSQIASVSPRGSIFWGLSCVHLGLICEICNEPKQAQRYYGEYARYLDPYIAAARTDVPGAWRGFREKHELREIANTSAY